MENQIEKPNMEILDTPSEPKIENSTIEESISDYAGPHAQNKSQKEKKFVALYKARTILSKIGTMTERNYSKRQLERMKRLGLKSM